jgi:uncharacterized protein
MDATLPDLIRQMLQPGLYPHPVQEPIQLLQTHISYILLTGEYAYKVKKPVNFGFLDFTTLEKRHHFCQEELRLNRRLSPELYLAVVPIVQDSDSSRIRISETDLGTIVDYTIQMRQFPQEALLSQLFQQDKLTPEMVQELGLLVAQFHTNAEIQVDLQSYGSLTSIQQVAANNYDISEAFIESETTTGSGVTQNRTQLTETQNFTHQFFTEHADWFLQRQAEGKIREGHGDLHLNNICFYPNKIRIFDCIEFNPEFRIIDVMYDVAFLVMDLEFQGRVDLANLFLNTYLEHTGDYWGAALMPLYLSMRAYIRGNINSLTVQDSVIPATEKTKSLQLAKAYYRLAWDYTQRSHGQLLLMSGLSGSGKSSIARQLAQRLNALHLRSDAVRKHLSSTPLYQRGDTNGTFGSGIYTPEMTAKTYDYLLELGLFLAQQGWTVILDAKYDRQALRQTALAAATAAQLPIHFIQCTAPVEVLRDRLKARTGDIADATADMLDAQIKVAEPFTSIEEAMATVLNTDQPLAPQLDKLATQVKFDYTQA